MNFRAMVGQMNMGMPGEAPAGKPEAKSSGSPLGHLKKAHAAHKSGDSKSAKGHAFNFIKSLGSKPSGQANPKAPTGVVAPIAPSPDSVV